MKKLLLSVIFVLFTIGCIAQESTNLIKENFPTKDGKIFYQEVVEVAGKSQNDLYVSILGWAVSSFGNSDEVIKTKDKELGIITIKAFVEKGHNSSIINPKNWFILSIELKEGRFRYTLTDIEYEFSVSSGGMSQHHQEPFENWMKPSSHRNIKKRAMINEDLGKYCKSLNFEFEGIIESLKVAMDKTGGDEW